MSKPLNYYKTYVPLTVPEKHTRIKGLFRIFNEYMKDTGLNKEEFLYNRDSLYEIIDRVDKRKVYFRVFYNKLMSERNEVALYCFWILKLAPFFCTSNTNIRVNVNFAIYFLLKVIQYNCIKRGQRVLFSDEYVKALKYACAFRDISKEAIMAIVESMVISATPGE